MIARATAVAAALCFAAAAPVMAADQPSTNAPAMTPATAPKIDGATDEVVGVVSGKDAGWHMPHGNFVQGALR